MYVPKSILVTGGLGYIGSEVINRLCEEYTGDFPKIIVVDKMSYCSRLGNLRYTDRVQVYQLDINDTLNFYDILVRHNVDTILHFAAATHVDNSFSNVKDFIYDNIQGTTSILEACRKYAKIHRFIHVSTDEVYGEIEFGKIQGCTEDSPTNVTNPYAGSKLATEALVRSYRESYKIPIIITRGNNVFGSPPGQYPEKLIPRFIMLLLNDKPLTIQGNGSARRTFVHVTDVANAFLLLLKEGKDNEIYNIGSNNEYSVLEMANILAREIYGSDYKNKLKLEYIKDRDFNDKRYHIDSSKIYALGWKESKDFLTGIRETIEFYRQNKVEFDFKMKY